MLGFPAAARHITQPLHVDPVDAALGRASEAHVEADGAPSSTRAPSIKSKTNKPSKERVAVGPVALARFPAGTELQRVGATQAVPAPGIVATVGRATEGSFGALATQSRDLGSVDFEAGLVQLREAFLALDAMSAGTQADARAAKIAVDLIK